VSEILKYAGPYTLCC